MVTANVIRMVTANVIRMVTANVIRNWPNVFYKYCGLK